MDPARAICVGCGRTLDEIARWGSMSDAERAGIMRGLGGRLGEQTKELELPAQGTRTI